uniref:Glucose-methanol-choline oxidoreductase N-terminal domain-containing protein n=1 Tax=Timema douglasi TaxID=61478 RepID=A0A7R8VP09_TIMDO|nr:unnamed protein product [Timema douglasi]
MHIGGWSVLLLEAGGDETPLSEISAMAPTLEGGPMDLAVQDRASIRFLRSYERFTMLQANTINGMLYDLGNRRDYYNWDWAGNIGWSYDEVLPYFKKSENMGVERYLNSSFHKTGGYLTMEEFRYHPKILDTLLKSAKGIGYQSNDINGEKQIGFGLAYGTVRCSTTKTPARNCLNFDICLNSSVVNILIDSNKKVTQDVVFKMKMQRHTVVVRKEVIVSSAGAINSPNLLMLSGIRPPSQLLEAGILPIIADLKVGQNLQDRITLGGLVYTIQYPIGIVFPRISNPEKFTQFLLQNDGPLMTLGVGQAL